MHTQRRPSIARTASLFGVGTLLSLGGCSLTTPRGGTLGAADFRAPDADAAAPAAAERHAPAMRVEQLEAGSTGSRFAVLEGAPTLAPDVPTVPDASPVMMDSLIGDINGTPVYATTFFSLPIEARLRGLAAKHRNNKQAWMPEATIAIGGIYFDPERQRTVLFGRLGDLIRDELLLAEARASLTPEQKQGLISFIDQVRRDLVSSGGGGQAAVDESLRAQGEAGGLEAKLKENIDRQLVYASLREKILPRVSVSWHDVQVEYERRIDEFNPPSTAVFRVIWLPTKNTELVERFSSDIGAGVPFVELSERPENLFTGGIHEQVFKGEYSKATLFGPKEFNEPAQSLRPGSVAGPILFSERTAWIYLDHVDTPPSTPIYDAQLSIYNSLREKKLNAEMDKYLVSLLDSQSIDKLSKMTDKLLAIATERYFNAPP